jgi:hypothetical protein
VPTPFPGVLTLAELMDLVDTVRRRDPGSRPDPRVPVGGPRSDANCLGLTTSAFEDVIAELEGLFGIPLLLEARRAGTCIELVALVNSQVTSGV